MFQNYYRRRGQLQGHFGAIYSLVATDDGKLLASGGNDGTRIWNLAGMVEISARPATGGLRGATTAITWINRDDEPGDILVYGTINGYLVTSPIAVLFCLHCGCSHRLRLHYGWTQPAPGCPYA
ncbi:hypothetical protein B0H13DRAFT_1900699 [Mycena leptocephala]|nr:hypothetical protein B0H13DRAFT_1900699 [Mycena leptocephala]